MPRGDANCESSMPMLWCDPKIIFRCASQNLRQITEYSWKGFTLKDENTVPNPQGAYAIAGMDHDLPGILRNVHAYFYIRHRDIEKIFKIPSLLICRRTITAYYPIQPHLRFPRKRPMLMAGCPPISFSWASFSMCCARYGADGQFRAWLVVCDMQPGSAHSPLRCGGVLDTWRQICRSFYIKTAGCLRYFCRSWQHLCCRILGSERWLGLLACALYTII